MFSGGVVPPEHLCLISKKSKAMKTIAIVSNEFTETYEDYLLSDVASAANRKLMWIAPRIVTTKDGESVLVADPTVKSGDKVLRLDSLWSRNLATPEDADRLQSFDAVDAVVRFGYYADEKTGETVTSKPKVIALIDASGKPFFLHGGKREYHADAE